MGSTSSSSSSDSSSEPLESLLVKSISYLFFELFLLPLLLRLLLLLLLRLRLPLLLLPLLSLQDGSADTKDRSFLLVARGQYRELESHQLVAQNSGWFSSKISRVTQPAISSRGRDKK